MAVRKKPRTPKKSKKANNEGTWEVGLLRVPGVRIAEVQIEGMLLVVETSGLVRAVHPLTGDDTLSPIVIAAAARSTHVPASRPARIRCSPEILDRLEEAAQALGATLVAADWLPRVDEVAESLAEHLGTLPAGFPVPDPDAWRPVVRKLFEQAPWEHLPDQVTFSLSHPDLEGWVVVVLGNAGLQRGLTICPTPRMLDALRNARTSEPPPDFTAYCVHFDAPEDLPPAHHGWADAHGLVFDGLALLPFHMRADGPRALQRNEAERVLAATQAVLEVWNLHGPTLQSQPTSTSVLTPIGLVQVETSYGGEVEPERLVPEAHLLFFELGAALPRMCFKAAKRDAERIAHRMEAVEALVVDAGWEAVQLAARLTDGEVVPIAELPAHRDLWTEIREEVALVVLQGGAKRRSYRPSDVILERRVAIEGNPLSAPLDENWRDNASYAGPPATWPLASTVLLDFGSVLSLEALPPDTFEAALTFAVTVWDAVVLEDLGDSTIMVQLREQLRGVTPDELLEMLIDRKREEFPEDTRVMTIERITWAAGQANVRVQWTDGRRSVSPST